MKTEAERFGMIHPAISFAFSGWSEFGLNDVALAAVVSCLKGRTAGAVTASARGLIRLRGLVRTWLPLEGRPGVGKEEAVMAGFAFAMNPGGMTGVIEDNIAGAGGEDQLTGGIRHLALGGSAGNQCEGQNQTTYEHR